MNPHVRRPKSWKLYGRCDECGVDPGLRCRDMDDRPVPVVCKGRPLAKEPPRVFCAGCGVELAPTGKRLVSPESWCSGACRMRTYSRRDAEAHRAFVSKFKAKRTVDDEVDHASP